ncbi:MAG: alpha/beta hydrolase [Vicinamibacterales bacterium]
MIKMTKGRAMTAAAGALTAILAGYAPIDARRPALTPAPKAIALWPGGAPGASGTADGDTPALLSYLPTTARNTGAAVLVIPGGGYTKLNLDSEGAAVAAWLNEQGIAAFVLRYRLAPKYQKDSAAADTARGVQYIRAHAADFKVAPNRIGIMGFGSGAELEAATVYNHTSTPDASATDVVGRASSAPNFMALVFGSAPLPAAATTAPPTFLVGSSRTADNQAGLIDLWARLRAVRAPVDAHFFAHADSSLGLASKDPAVSAWPQSFLSWVRFRGFLSDAPRIPLKGMAYLDGRPLPHGYVVLTPLDAVGAGPVVCRVLNSTAGMPIGQFVVPAAQGPTPGRYRVEVHQNANRWLSNSFTPGLTRDPAFGHSRILSPSIDDQHVYRKVHPTDKTDYIVEIKAGSADDLKFEVFTGAAPVNVALPTIAGLPDPTTANAGVAAYYEELKHTPNPVPGIPEPTLLWPQGAPGAVADASGAFTTEDKPAILAFPAPAAHNTGAALLILPGGAFTNRVEDHEGVQIARWLNREGIAGFVLRYRIQPNYNGQVSTMDAHRAIRYIRAHASEYRISPDRVGVIGFSAGSELEGDAFFNNVLPGEPAAADPLDRISTKSNFNVLIYGGRNLRDAATAPPTFMFVTLEDGGNHLAPEINVLNGLRTAGIPVEAHWYQDGPHGTSMSPGDPQLGQWPDLLKRWMGALGFLTGK